MEGAVKATANSNRCVLGRNSAIGTIKCIGRESVIDAVMIVVVMETIGEQRYVSAWEMVSGMFCKFFGGRRLVCGC